MTALAHRRATLSDVAVIRSWDADPDVIASGGVDDDWEWEKVLQENPPYQEVWLGVVGVDPIGVVVLLDATHDPSQYWGSTEPGVWALDIWIGSSEHRGRGWGTAMMLHALSRCFERHGASEVRIDPLDSNKRAIAFYRKLGFEDVGVRQFGQDSCWVMNYSRQRWLDTEEK